MATTPPKKLGAAPAGPTKNEKTGQTAERTPANGPLRIENNGGDGAQGDWAVFDSNGVKLNAPITTPQSLAYWLKQRPGFAQRVENLAALGVVPPFTSKWHEKQRPGYRISDVALGKKY
jgi:hypothetical protein